MAKKRDKEPKDPVALDDDDTEVLDETDDEEGADVFDGDDALDDDEIASETYLLGWCASCQANRSHTLVEEVDEDDEEDAGEQIVLCTECGDEHAHEAPRHRSAKQPKPKVEQRHYTLVTAAELESPEGVAEAWNRLTTNVDTSALPAYSPNVPFKVADIFSHPHFGVGVVYSVLSPTKVEVLFSDKPRRLACNR